MKWLEAFKDLNKNVKYAIDVIAVLRSKLKKQGFNDSDIIKMFTAVNETVKSISEEDQ